MASTTIVLGTKKALKPIELKTQLVVNNAGIPDLKPANGPITAADYAFIELVSKNYFPKDRVNDSGIVGNDLIFCYDDPNTREGCLFLGWWNDGVVAK